MIAQNINPVETKEPQNRASEPVVSDVDLPMKSPMAKISDAEESEEEEWMYEPMIYIIEPYIEDIEQYRRGGHHPVHLEDMLNDRYEVWRKLGSGGFGNVWLCYDTSSKKWRAVKVMTADHSKRGREQKVYDQLRARASVEDLFEKHHLAVPLDEFWIDGPNGRHLCIVLPVFGKSLNVWELLLSGLDEGTVAKKKDVCRKLTEAVRFLHHAGICHGDLKPQNVLLTLKGVEDMGKDELLELIGEPDLYGVERRNGKDPAPRAPEYIVAPPDHYWWRNFCDGSIAIIDFGESFLVNDPPDEAAWSWPYAAPEILLPRQGIKQGINGYGSDIWSLATTIFEVREGHTLFNGDRRASVVHQIEVILGALPEPYLTEAVNTGLKCDEDEKLEERQSIIEGTGYSDPLEAVLGKEKLEYVEKPGEPCQTQASYRSDREEVLQLADLLRKMLHYNPNKRISTDQVLKHPWMGGHTPFYMTLGLEVRKRVLLLFLILAVCVAEIAFLLYTSFPWHFRPLMSFRTPNIVLHKDLPCQSFSDLM